MRSLSLFLSGFLALAVMLTPMLADAKAGGGASMGSRGTRTYSAPPPTNTAPSAAAPFERSMTPPSATPSAPSYSPGYQPGYAAPRSGFGGSFASGLMGGLIGAGIGGLLFGHGLFGGMGGGASFLGLLIQGVLLFFLVRWLLRLVFRDRPAFVGVGAMNRSSNAGPGPMPVGAGVSATRAIQITPADYQGFEQLLKTIQAAWSAQDLSALRSMATPEMVSYFSEQLSEQASRGVRNTVSDVRLLQGDLAEAWSEGSREYATVAMKFSMVDVTRDASERVVDGSPTDHVTTTELWTFLRSPGGRWVLSAIQQVR